MISVSMKKKIIAISLLCAVNTNAVPPDLAALSVAVTPFVAGAARTAYLCNFESQRTHSIRCSDSCPHKEQSPQDHDACTSTYLGGFFLGVMPGINLLFGLLGQETRSHSLPTDVGFKAGLATNLSIIAAFKVYGHLAK